jgi:TetR/AcrR family transcriptional regulator, mexJK operon transcriptional repressor
MDQTARDRILTAATQLLAESPDGRTVSMERVAATAQLSRATVYRYFGDRTALLRAAAEARGDDRAALDARAQILDAALAVFAERGIPAATLREIAQRAGLSLSGLHWHFRNKEELVAALATHVPVLPAITAELGLAATSDLEDQLAHIAQVALAFLREHQAVLRLAIAEMERYPDVARLVSQHTVGRVLPLLGLLFERHTQRGLLTPGPSMVRAQAFMSMLVMRVLMQPAIGDLLELDAEASAREYVQILLHGIQATDPAPARRPQRIPLDD